MSTETESGTACARLPTEAEPDKSYASSTSTETGEFAEGCQRLNWRSAPLVFGREPPQWPCGMVSSSKAGYTGVEPLLFCLSHTSDVKIGVIVAALGSEREGGARLEGGGCLEGRGGGGVVGGW